MSRLAYHLRPNVDLPNVKNVNLAAQVCTEGANIINISQATSNILEWQIEGESGEITKVLTILYVNDKPNYKYWTQSHKGQHFQVSSAHLSPSQRSIRSHILQCLVAGRSNRTR